MDTLENKPVDGFDNPTEGFREEPLPVRNELPAELANEEGVDAPATDGASEEYVETPTAETVIEEDADASAAAMKEISEPLYEETAEVPSEGFFAEAGDVPQTEAAAEPTDKATQPPRSPYAASPYVSYDEAHSAGTTEQWQAHFRDAQPAREPRPRKKKERKRSTGKLVAAALACVLAGSTIGGVVTGVVLNNRWNKTASELQAQIDELESKGSGTVIHSTSTPVGKPTSSTGMLSPSQVYEQNVSSVVSVTTTGYSTSMWGSAPFTANGSGFILTADGYILTNYHVIEGYTTVEISTIDSVTYEAQVVGHDALSDVALLKVEAENLPSVIVGDSDALAVGDMVAAIGNPLGELASTQTVGYLSAKNRMVNTDGTILNMLQTDAAINSGNSGGPLFNMYGQVIGITTAKYSGSSSSGASIEGIGFAIPINTVMDLVDDLMKHGYVTGQAYLGITVLEMDASVAAAYGLPAGPKVDSVTPGSCAEKAGLHAGDIITALGDTKVSSYSDLTYALRTHRAGDSSTISVFRAGQELTLNVTFDEKPANTSIAVPPTQETQPQNNGSSDYFGGFPFDMFP